MKQIIITIQVPDGAVVSVNGATTDPVMMISPARNPLAIAPFTRLTGGSSPQARRRKMAVLIMVSGRVQNLAALNDLHAIRHQSWKSSKTRCHSDATDRRS